MKHRFAKPALFKFRFCPKTIALRRSLGEHDRRAGCKPLPALTAPKSKDSAAEETAKWGKGMTPELEMMTVCGWGKCHRRLERLIKSRRPDVNFKNEDGETALHIACGVGASEMVDKLLNANDLPQLEQCLHASDGLATKIGDVMQHFVTVDINNTIKGVEECIGIVTRLPEELASCNVLGHDADRITQWASIFLNPLKLVADITANIAGNINSIIATGTAMVG